MRYCEAERARYRVAGPLIALFLLLSAGESRATVPSFSLGSGHSMVVEYDLDFQPLRKYTGLEKPVDVTPLADGTILLVDENRRVLLFDGNGTVLWSEQIGPAPQRARPRPGGGWLVTSGDLVMALRADRSVEWQIDVKNVKAAASLPNGNVVIAHNDRGQGWLAEMTPDGKVLWQSRSRGHVDTAGAWVDEAPDQFFHSTWSVDASSDGTIFTTDFDGGSLRVLSPDHRVLRAIQGFHHVTDTRFGPEGELIAVSPEDFRVSLILPNGTTTSFEPDLRPWCAALSAQKTLFVGLQSEPERAALNATAARSKAAEPDPPWRQRALPLPTIGMLGALAVALALRRRKVSNGIHKGASSVVQSPTPAQKEHWAKAVRVGLGIVNVALLAGGAYFAWQGIVAIQAHGFGGEAWRFAAGCVAGGLALRVLNVIVGGSRTLSSFVSAEWRTPPPRPRSAGVTALGTLSLVSIGICLLVLVYLPNEQATAIALWLTAQIWLLAAALPGEPVPASEQTPRSVWVLLGLLLAAASVTRFWQIGYYPDHIHHDQSLYGNAVLQTMWGTWKPFFVMDPWTSATMTRVWLAPCIAAFKLFGVHYWALRLTGAISGVLAVWATYLLGAALFNRRTGLIAAALVTVNGDLLLYSRVPYIMDSTWPFVLSLYCAVIGLQRGSRLHWCLAGFLIGWAMLTVRSFTFFPIIGGAIFLYFLCVYPRVLWRHRVGLLWLVGGAAIVYLPMLPHMLTDSALMNRVRDQLVLQNPDGSLRRDGALWASQLRLSFGSIIYYGESAPWNVATGGPICTPIFACLFGMGLIYLLTFWHSPATFVLVAWIVIAVFFGSAVLPSPPTLYHYLVAIVAIAIIAAVTLDRTLALADRWRPVLWRTPLWLGALGLLGTFAVTDLGIVWRVVRRPPPAADGSQVFHTNARVMAARFIGEHREYRHYLVRSRRDITCADALFVFFGADSDMSDLSTSLHEALPVPPVESAAGVAFVVLPERAAERQAILSVYPTATVQEIHVSGSGSLWTYLVDAEAVRVAFANAHATS